MSKLDNYPALKAFLDSMKSSRGRKYTPAEKNAEMKKPGNEAAYEEFKQKRNAEQQARRAKKRGLGATGVVPRQRVNGGTVPRVNGGRKRKTADLRKVQFLRDVENDNNLSDTEKELLMEKRKKQTKEARKRRMEYLSQKNKRPPSENKLESIRKYYLQMGKITKNTKFVQFVLSNKSRVDYIYFINMEFFQKMRVMFEPKIYQDHESTTRQLIISCFTEKTARIFKGDVIGFINEENNQLSRFQKALALLQELFFHRLSKNVITKDLPRNIHSIVVCSIDEEDQQKNPSIDSGATKQEKKRTGGKGKYKGKVQRHEEDSDDDDDFVAPRPPDQAQQMMEAMRPKTSPRRPPDQAQQMMEAMKSKTPKDFDLLKFISKKISTNEKLREMNYTFTFKHKLSSGKLVVEEFNKSSAKRLLNKKWYNSDIINAYMAILGGPRNPGSRKSIFLSTQFYTKLTSSSNPNNVKTWTKDLNTTGNVKIFVPVNIANQHWILVMIDVKNQAIVSMDSLGKDNKFVRDELLEWMSHESAAKGVKMDKKVWSSYPLDVPTQTNGYDCGPFVCMFAMYASNDLPMTFTQNDILKYRKTISWAILNSSEPKSKKQKETVNPETIDEIREIIEFSGEEILSAIIRVIRNRSEMFVKFDEMVEGLPRTGEYMDLEIDGVSPRELLEVYVKEREDFMLNYDVLFDNNTREFSLV